MTFTTLRYDVQDGIATVTLDRPEKNNAISMEMRADFRALADELYTNESVRVAIITGGGKAPQALGIAKRVLQNCVSADLQTGRTIESFGQSILIKTKDHREGVTAFREKRRPKFEGR